MLGAVGGGPRPDHNFQQKKYNFLFLLPFDAEAFKTCKNKIKLFNLIFVCSTLSWVVEYMTPADSDCVLWLHFQICSIIFPYKGILSKKDSHKKVVVWPQLGRGWAPPKTTTFLTPPLTSLPEKRTFPPPQKKNEQTDKRNKSVDTTFRLKQWSC